MSLRYKILSFVDRARKQPAAASDPRLLDDLDRAAQESFDGSFVAMSAPASPMSWESVSILRGATLTGPRVPFRFPRPVEIVGFLPTVLPILPASGGGTVPTTDSIACAIDTDNQNYLTAGDGISTNAGSTAGPYVTLTALSVQAPRVVGYKLRNPTPDIGFTFRWKLDPGVAPGIFRDVLVSMAIYARYLA